MEKIKVTVGIYYLNVPELDLRIMCGCPENSIKFIMQKGLTPPVEKNGFNLVSGPNAILLNDISILNSHFLNFAEFPVLHQQYFQGAAYNGTHEKFTLIGNQNVVNHQSNYIYRGIQGLVSKEEILESGISEDVAEKFFALRKTYMGNNRELDILNKVYLNGKTRIKDDLYVERIAPNTFRFTYKDEEEVINLDLDSTSKGVGLPYNIKPTNIPLDDFTVTTVGDGNGWNPHVPCMGSVLTIKGRRYLVDSGPGSLDLIKHLGISPSEVEGVFVTHSHDDHFAGILSMLNGEFKIKFFATPIVRYSIQKKFMALLNIGADILKSYIDFIDIKEDVWTDFGDFEVKPNYSFHTVETNVFYFKVRGTDNKEKVYGHITDIISRKDLDKLIERGEANGLSRSWAYPWFDKYLEPVDLKRIDAGGGVVHGDKHDFAKDESGKIILSHLDKDIDVSENPHFIKPTNFGYSEVLIRAGKNHLMERAEEILNEVCGNFPRKVLKEGNIKLFKPGEKIISKGDKLGVIYLVLSGYVKSSGDFKRTHIKGDFLYSFNREKRSLCDYISDTYSYLIKLDSSKFFKFIKSKKLNKEFRTLRNINRFSYGLSFPTQIKLAKAMSFKNFKKGELIHLEDNNFYIVVKGQVDIIKGEKTIDTLNQGSIGILALNSEKFPRKTYLKDVAKDKCKLLVFNQDKVRDIISFKWNLVEEYYRITTIVETLPM